MARSQFADTAIDQYGSAVISTRVTVYNAGTSTLSTVYENESGSTLKGNPFNATSGYVSFWMEPGSYDVVIADTAIPASFTSKTVRFDSIPAVDGVIAQTIADESVVWNHFTPDRASLGFEGVFNTNVRSISTGTAIPPVGSDTPLTFTQGKTDTIPDSFNASTGIYTAEISAMYLGFVSLTYSISVTTSGANRPRLMHYDGLVGNNYMGYMQSNIGNNHFAASFVVRLLAGATTRVSINTGITVNLESGGNTSTVFALFPIYPL